jgi:hypothetical protein
MAWSSGRALQLLFLLLLLDDYGGYNGLVVRAGAATILNPLRQICLKGFTEYY